MLNHLIVIVIYENHKDVLWSLVISGLH